MCKNLDQEKFISKSYAQKKNDGKCQESRYFGIRFLKNSENICKK